MFSIVALEICHNRSIEALDLAVGVGILCSPVQLSNVHMDTAWCKALREEVRSGVCQQVEQNTVQKDSTIQKHDTCIGRRYYSEKYCSGPFAISGLSR